MVRIVRRVLPLLAMAATLPGCVAYPAGYGDYGGYSYAAGYIAPSVVVATPCCAYGGGSYGGYRRY